MVGIKFADKKDERHEVMARVEARSLALARNQARREAAAAARGGER